MKFFYLLSCFLFIAAIIACREELIYEYEQPLQFEITEISFVESLNAADSLIVTMSVDHLYSIGLAPNEVDPPFHRFDYVIDSEENLVTYGSGSIPPFYTVNPSNEEVFFSAEDNRPEYNCYDYFITVIDSETDTFFVVYNKFYNNIRIDFYTEDGLIDFEEVFGNSFCNAIGFSGRIPKTPEKVGDYQLSNSPFRIIKINKYKSYITYNMTSAGFYYLFRDSPFKIVITLVDQELNESAPVETEFVTLDEIKR